MMTLAIPGTPAGPTAPAQQSSPTPHRPSPGSNRSLIAEALDNRRCPRRVRHELRDGVAVAAFSAASSTVAALALGLLLSRVG